MGWGSSGTPPWVDAEKINEEKKKQKAAQDAAKIKALEEENFAKKSGLSSWKMK